MPNTTQDSRAKRSLPIVSAPQNDILSDADLEAELRRFEENERAKLGLDQERNHWKDTMLTPNFKKSEREEVTLLVCGLTMAHDFLVEGGLRGLGYKVQHLEVPDVAALQVGKEFGNRGQCNPTYFTVGNLVKYLCDLRDKHGWSTEDVIRKHVFLTAGACGPCRFGMYVTEYRKALRDAGFDGFRVMLFQQTGGLEQATGDDVGLEMNPEFFITIVKALVIGDVINGIGYRLRPYELESGATDRALENAKRTVYEAFLKKSSTLLALRRARAEFESIKLDKLRAKPKVAIIGEFWAMTTEGDGNYQLQRFLESEGAEADIQFVTAWLLYSIWEGRRDTAVRRDLRGTDGSTYGLAGLTGATDIAKKLAVLRLADKIVRVAFHTFAYAGGFYGYKLPNMDEIAEVADSFYSNDLRGGEGHMEVGKLIVNTVHKKAHMTLSVKPFGCMPSASVSDGVQSLITERYPGSIYCAVETSGDGRVNFYSRIQMYMFKARAAAEAELESALNECGVSVEQVRAFIASHPRFAHPLHRSPHRASGSPADLVYEVAPYITQTFAQRATKKLTQAATKLAALPKTAATSVSELRTNAPEIKERIAADLEILREIARGSLDSFKPLAERILRGAVSNNDPVQTTTHVAAAAE